MDYSSQLIHSLILGEAHRGVKGFVKDQAAQPIEGASMKVRIPKKIPKNFTTVLVRIFIDKSLQV